MNAREEFLAISCRGPVDRGELDAWLEQSDRSSVSWNEQNLVIGMRQPMGFPPIEQSIVPGDQIAIAIAPSVPHSHQVVASVVRLLGSYGVDPSQLRIVLEADCVRARNQLRSELEPLGLSHDQIRNHDPRNADELEFLAADEDANAIYVNRFLLDADMVIPILPLRPQGTLAHFGLWGMAPWFVDHLTSKRIRAMEIDQTIEGMRRRYAFGKWVGNLCGVHFILGLELDARAQLQPRVGAPEELEKLELSSPFQDGSESLDWIVAHLGALEDELSWDELMVTAFRLANQIKENGCLVLRTHLNHRLQGALRILAGQGSEEETESQLMKSDLPNTLAAILIMLTLRRVHLYLWSELRSDAVESLGIGCLDSVDQLHRLIRGSPQGLLLAEARSTHVPFAPSTTARLLEKENR